MGRRRKHGKEAQLPLFPDRRIEASRKAKSELRGMENGKYIVYVDESGHHSLTKFEERFPVFSLAFCVFHKDHYSDFVIPKLQKFKFKHFGHDQINLHESDIRKRKYPFNFFTSEKHHSDFLDELTQIVRETKFILIDCVIDKRNVPPREAESSNAYQIALRHCLETLFDFLSEKSEHDKLTYVVVEGIGKKEDQELELEFRRICDGQNRHRHRYPFDVILIDKTRLSTGLQLADLVARPVALNVIDETQRNRAFEVLEKKFYCRDGRRTIGQNYRGWGLKVYPTPK